MSELKDKATLLKNEIEEDEQAVIDLKNKVRHKKNDLKIIEDAIKVLEGNNEIDNEKDVGLVLPIVAG